MSIITSWGNHPVATLCEKAAKLLKVVLEKASELEGSWSPAARAAAVCLRHGIPPYQLRRARLEGSTLRLKDRVVSLSMEEVELLKPWVGSSYGLRTVAYHAHKTLKDLGLRAYDIHLLRRIAENQPPKSVPARLLKKLEEHA